MNFIEVISFLNLDMFCYGALKIYNNHKSKPTVSNFEQKPVKNLVWFKSLLVFPILFALGRVLCAMHNMLFDRRRCCRVQTRITSSLIGSNKLTRKAGGPQSALRRHHLGEIIFARRAGPLYYTPH